MPKSPNISLREARLEAGLTAQELAAMAGISRTLLTAIETDRNPGKFDVLHRISDALHIPFRLLWPSFMEKFETQLRIIRQDDCRIKREARARARDEKAAEAKAAVMARIDTERERLGPVERSRLGPKSIKEKSNEK